MSTPSTVYVDFTQATFLVPGLTLVEPTTQSDALMKALVYRPRVFQRNDIRWIAAHAWRSGDKERGIAALKEVKQHPDQQFLDQAAKPIATLARQLFGASPAEAVTSVPCGHSRRGDCFGRGLAEAVAQALELPFVQVFADRPCSGVSHPKQNAALPPLWQIGAAPRSVIVVDDIATSGQHLEEVILALRHLDVTASALAWISGSATGGEPVSPNPVKPTKGRLTRLGRP